MAQEVLFMGMMPLACVIYANCVLIEFHTVLFVYLSLVLMIIIIIIVLLFFPSL